VRGCVKKVIPGKGFGFILAEGGKDIFFHRSAVQNREFGRLREGTKVEFDVERTNKGPRAISVRIDSHEGERRATERRVSTR
jgi:CspA family cold shock protein